GGGEVGGGVGGGGAGGAPQGWPLGRGAAGDPPVCAPFAADGRWQVNGEKHLTVGKEVVSGGIGAVAVQVADGQCAAGVHVEGGIVGEQGHRQRGRMRGDARTLVDDD